MLLLLLLLLQEFLYHMNDGKGTDMPPRIIKTTLEGEIVWETSGALVWRGLPFLPTDAVRACVPLIPINLYGCVSI